MVTTSKKFSANRKYQKGVTRSYETGQTLIEAIAALSVISIVVTAIGVSVTAALNNATYNKNITLATKYAQEGSEIMQQIRDESYTNFKNTTGTYCLAKGQTTLGAAVGSCTTPNVDTFIRSVDIQQNGCAPNVAQVLVTVSFKDGKCAAGTYCHKQNDLSCLSTQNPIPTP